MPYLVVSGWAAFAFAHRPGRVVIVGRSTNDQPNQLVMTGTLDEVLGQLPRPVLEAYIAVLRADLAAAALSKRSTPGRWITEATARCDVLVNNFAYSTDFGKALEIPVSKWNTA